MDDIEIRYADRFVNMFLVLENEVPIAVLTKEMEVWTARVFSDQWGTSSRSLRLIADKLDEMNGVQ